MNPATSDRDASYPETAAVIDIAASPGVVDDSGSTSFLRSNSFLVAWTEVRRAPGSWLQVDTSDEYLLLLPNCGAEISWDGGTAKAPPRSVCVLPPGSTSVRLTGEGRCLRMFAPEPQSLSHVEVFGADKPPAGARPLRPIYPPYRRRTPIKGPVIYELDGLPNSTGMPRAKLFQSATMSFNWVEYMGPRDRSQLSPHAHQDIEQASIALEGEFCHHFRTTWTSDARLWRPDQHVTCGPGSVALIPPPIIHTSEGIGPGRHILIDVFAPPRADFIAKGQILNSDEYIAPPSAR